MAPPFSLRSSPHLGSPFGFRHERISPVQKCCSISFGHSASSELNSLSGGFRLLPVISRRRKQSICRVEIDTLGEIPSGSPVEESISQFDKVVEFLTTMFPAWVGKENVVQVITDNASNCRRMGELVMEEFPSIVWTPCASHCLDLLMEDIGKLPWIHSVMTKATTIVSFFKKKPKALAIFREYNKLELVKPAKTRFAYMWLVLDRLHKVHADLRRCVVSELWYEWNDSSLAESQQVQRSCLDVDFWQNVEALVRAMRPLFILLRVTDIEGCTLGLVYHYMTKARTEIESCTTLPTERLDEILSLVDKRWEWMRRPIHGLAAYLHPLFRSRELSRDATLREAMDNYLSRVYSEEDQLILDAQMETFVNNLGTSFSRPTSRRRSIIVKSISWWETYGYSCMDLQSLAMRVLSQDCSAGACERNWSSYSLIHTKIRNRLSTFQLERLVYCRANLRLVRKIKAMDNPNQVLLGAIIGIYKPAAVGLGFLAQYFIKPILGFFIASTLKLSAPLATGLILVSCCPGGQASNVATYISKGNVALSVLMTTCSTIGAIIMTPLLTKILAGQLVPVDAAGLALSTFQVVLLPTIIGVLSHEYFPKFTEKITTFTPLVGVILTTLLCASPIGQVSTVLQTQGVQLILPVAILHAAAFILGYWSSRFCKFGESTSRTISIECGMQSSALGFLLAQKHFTNPLVAVPSAVSVVFMALGGSALAVFWRNKPIPLDDKDDFEE